jgi:hypothetical protein
MRRAFVPLLFFIACGVMVSTSFAQTAHGPNDKRVVKSPPPKGVRVEAISSTAVDDPPTTDSDGVHTSFTGGIIDRGNPLFDGIMIVSETVKATNGVGTVSGVVTIASGKGDKQATVVLEFKGQIRKNLLAGEWKVSGATGIAEGLKGTGKFAAQQTRRNLFMTLTGVVAKP